MLINYQLALTMFHAMGLMALVAIAFGSIERMDVRPVIRMGLHGLAFGAASVGAMFDQVRLGDGILVDGRAIIVGFAGAFGGIFAGLIAASMAALYRLLQGGAGALAGIVGIYTAAILGMVWARLVKPSRRMSFMCLCCLGFAISCYVLTAFILPFPTALALLGAVGPYIVAAAVISALIMGFFLVREMRLIGQERLLQHTAFTDALTGLPNRRSFDRALARALKVANGPERISFAVVIMDVDHFKRVNDTHGHAAGDAVLQAVGQALQGEVRHRDTVARLGGEEFGVILADGDGGRAALVAQRLREAVEELVTRFEDKELVVTVSAGLTFFRAGDDAGTLTQRADEALYQAKALGRNRVVQSSRPSGRGVAVTQDA